MNKAAARIKENSTMILCLALIVLLFLIGNVITGGRFASPASTLKFASLIAFFGLGQMLIICAGGDIDLSVGYCATLVSCLTAGMMDGKNENLWKAVIMAILLGICIGAVNGALTVYVRLPSLVVTLAMSQILQGVVDVYCAGFTISGKPSPFLTWLVARNTGAFPNILFLLIILTFITMWILNETKAASRLPACGANETAAHLSGVDVKRVRIFAFIICDVIACLMGLILLGNLGLAFKDMASSYVMPSIAAVVIGGLSINGGHKNYLGVILGAIVLQTLTNLFVSLGWGDSGKYLGYGLILLLMLIVYVREKVSR